MLVQLVGAEILSSMDLRPPRFLKWQFSGNLSEVSVLQELIFSYLLTL